MVFFYLIILQKVHVFGQEFKPVPGERIDFLVSFGIFNAGEASMITDTSLYTTASDSSYKIDVFGKSVGLFDLFYKSER